MKRILMGFLILFAVGIVVSFMISFFRPKLDTEFATGAILRYKYEDKNIEARIDDKKSLDQFKTLLKDKIYTDHPSCSFSTDISITLYDEQKEIVLCLACDGCPTVRIGETDKCVFLTDEAGAKLKQILSQYGFSFPCL